MSRILHLLILFLPALQLLLQRPLSRRGALQSSLLLLGLSLLLWGQGQIGTTLQWSGAELLGLDSLSLCLLPFTAMIYCCILLCCPRSERTSGAIESLQLGLWLDLLMFSVRTPMSIALLWVLTHIPLFLEVRRRPGGNPRLLRILTLYLGLGCVLFGLGAWGLTHGAATSYWPYMAITLGIVLRKAIVPFHQWLPELFERGPMGHVIAFCAPQVGAYASIHVLTPGAPDELLVALGAAALATALYGACLACGQRSFRGVFAGLFMGQTSLVFAGLQCTTHVGLTGGLMLWISGGLALTGLGLCVWALEARRGRMTLDRFHGGFERSPLLAACFLIFGLTSCGFPGTLGFVSEELVLEGTTHIYPHVGFLAAVVAAVNGITVMRAYLHLFCGARAQQPLSQAMRLRERMALLALVVCLLGCGLYPQPFVNSRSAAADVILLTRHERVRP